jgi:lysophospholipase L1-like esterase
MLQVRNHAIGGRSSRTFITEGRWDRVLDSLKEGDFVLIQFGHNDGGPMDTGRARASIKGNGDETKEVTMEATGINEIVHSYGWYLRKYIEDSKAKGAIPIVLSPVPRNIWKDNKVARASNDYGKWASEAAKEGGAYFVDLNGIVASHYEQAGEEKVKTACFLKDHTHTTKIGAKLNASSVIEGITALDKCPLKDYLVSNVEKKLLK